MLTKFWYCKQVKVFIYTDGVTEATSDNDELYGEKKLKDYLNSNIEQNVETTIKGVKKDIDNFIGKAEQLIMIKTSKK